jgi:thiosulfate/3-mercaptopyruvate sulfurtransferase
VTEAPFSPLIGPEDLAARLDDPRLRLVDVRWVLGEPGRGRAQYEAGHLPGAIFLDLDADLSAPEGPGRHPLPSPAALRDRLEAAGIGSDDLVVAYDDAAGATAARLWWMLDDLGHQRVAVLDGGYRAWLAAGLPTTAARPQLERGRLHLREDWTKTIDRAAVADGLGTFLLLDARATPRYLGEIEPVDRVPGHIPTAVSAPTADDLGADGRMLAREDLAERFRALGADRPDIIVVSSCGSGVTACFNSLAMRLAGLPDPILYPGSYSDWTQAGLPVAVGPEPGQPPADISNPG